MENFHMGVMMESIIKYGRNVENIEKSGNNNVPVEQNTEVTGVINEGI